MEEIFKQYGAPIIIVSVIVALIVIFGFLLKDGGVVMDNFKNLISNFFQKANFTSGAAGETPGVIIAGILG